MTTPTQPPWSERTAPAEARPRVVFEDHMVVFACNGVREGFFPRRNWRDGFNASNESIMVVGPEDLRPENEAALKARLAAKVKEAKALPFSKIEAGNMQLSFFRQVNGEIIENELLANSPHSTAPILTGGGEKGAFSLAQHFSDLIPAIKEKWPTPEALKAIEPFRHDHDVLVSLIHQHFDHSSAKLYTHLKNLSKTHGKLKEFQELEAKMARSSMRFYLNLGYGDHRYDAVADSMVKIREDNSIVFDTKPLAALRNQLIDEQYRDLGAVIEKARDIMKHQSSLLRVADYALTDDERNTIQEVHNIAHRDAFYKPLVLAGYQNPELTVVLNKVGHGTNGTSFEGLNLMEVSRKPNGSTFDRTLNEELMHQGMERIYNNASLPYRDAKDSRKMLLEKAIAGDLKTFKETYTVLGLTSSYAYSTKDAENMHREVPVKTALCLNDGTVDTIRTLPGAAQALKQVEQLLHKVIIPDAKAYLAGQGLPEVGADFSRTASHRSQAGLPRTGWKVD